MVFFNASITKIGGSRGVIIPKSFLKGMIDPKARYKVTLSKLLEEVED